MNLEAQSAPVSLVRPKLDICSGPGPPAPRRDSAGPGLASANCQCDIALAVQVLPECTAPDIGARVSRISQSHIGVRHRRADPMIAATVSESLQDLRRRRISLAHHPNSDITVTLHQNSDMDCDISLSLRLGGAVIS
jgi:hypothetical protein